MYCAAHFGGPLSQANVELHKIVGCLLKTLKDRRSSIPKYIDGLFLTAQQLPENSLFCFPAAAVWGVRALWLQLIYDAGKCVNQMQVLKRNSGITDQVIM